MAGSEATTELRFESPGPGTWTLDAVHFPRPVTRYWAETHPAAFGRGTNDFARYYGILIDGMQMTYVNGFAYNQPRPVPEEEIPQRFRRAEEVYEGKLWREQLRDWDENIKPASIAAHRALQAVDPEALSADELAFVSRLRQRFATRVELVLDRRGGRIELRFHNDEELARLGDLLLDTDR